MAADRRRLAWVNAVLAVLVALTVLFAPTTGVQAMPCQQHMDHGQSGFEYPSVLSDGNSSLQGGLYTFDHKSCCAVPCGFCIILIDMVRTDPPGAMSFYLRFAWGNQTGSSLALSPMLGPPRVPV